MTQDKTTEYYDYDPQDAAEDDGGYKNYVFAEGVNVRRPKKGDDEATYLYVAPAFDFGADISTPEGRISTAWYRYPNDHPRAGHFTSWLRPYWVYEFVGKSTNILNPRTINPEMQVNPVGQLLKTVKTKPDWMFLAGLLPNGKKPEKDKQKQDELFKAQLIGPDKQYFAINGINRAMEAERENNISCVYTIPRTAMVGANRGKISDSWGLWAALDKKARNVSPEVLNQDFTKAWYWGDITRVDAMIPCKVYKADSPTGGKAKLYCMVPHEEGTIRPAPLIDGDYPWLSSRVRLNVNSELFMDYNSAEIIDVLVSLFSEYPEILIRAFESKVPGLKENLLKESGVVSESRVHQAGFGNSPNSRSEDKAPAPTPGKFAPQASGSTPPVLTPAPTATVPPTSVSKPKPPTPPSSQATAKPVLADKYWTVIGGEAAEISREEIQKQVNGGLNPLILNYDQSGSWLAANAMGFVIQKVDGITPPPIPNKPTPPKVPTDNSSAEQSQSDSSAGVVTQQHLSAEDLLAQLDSE